MSRIAARAGALVASAARAALFAGAGVLRRADLLAMSSEAWRDFNATDTEIGAGLLDFERDVYARFLRPRERILVVGSGNGRDVIALAGDGHDVVGLEPSAEAADTARRAIAAHGRTVTVLNGAIEDAELPGRFDVVVFSYCTYGYIPGASHRIAALGRVRSALNDGGRVIVTYLGATAVMRGRAAQLARFSSRITGSDWIAEPHDVLVPRWKNGPIVQYEHRFTTEGAEREVQAAGFRVVYHRTLPDAPTLVLMRDETR